MGSGAKCLQTIKQSVLTKVFIIKPPFVSQYQTWFGGR